MEFPTETPTFDMNDEYMIGMYFYIYNLLTVINFNNYLFDFYIHLVLLIA